MRELSLFSGGGGGLLGSLLLGWTTVGYVEWDDYAQRILAARIRDGYLPDAPIFGDIRTFIGDGYAASYTGLVDILSGGIPCQPFSVAGKRAGADDPRNMWPATIATVRVVRPRYCFFENVPGLLISGYFGTIVNDLAESGYSVRWRCLSAAEVGAPHRRDRLWIVAYDAGIRPHTDEVFGEATGGSLLEAARKRQWGGWDLRTFRGVRRRVPDYAFSARSSGYPGGVDAVKAAGNAQIPLVAATAWRLLTADIERGRQGGDGRQQHGA